MRAGEATERSQDFLRDLHTTNPFAEDFLNFYSNWSRPRNGDFYDEIQRDNERGVGIANLHASQVSSLCKAQKDLNQTTISHTIHGYDSEDVTEIAAPRAGKSITLGPGSRLQVQTGLFESYIDTALYISKIWELSKLQGQAIM